MFPESGVGLLDDLSSSNYGGRCAEAVPAEFRRKVVDLVAAGRPVAQVAYDLQISAQTIYVWRRSN